MMRSAWLSRRQPPHPQPSPIMALMSPSMKRLAVSTPHVPPCRVLCRVLAVVHRARVASGLARCRHPSIRAHQGRAIVLAGARGDSKGGGAIYATALEGGQGDTRAHPPVEPARDRDSHARSSSRCGWDCGWERGRDHGSWRASGVDRRAVPEQRIEDAGHPAGEGHDGDVLAATRYDVQGPRVEGLRLRRPAPQDGDGDVNQEPAPVGGARLGDVTAAVALSRAALARHEAELRLDLVGVAAALDVVEGGDEGGGAVTGPMLGTVGRRWTRASCAVTRAIVSSAYASWALRCRMTASNGAMVGTRRPAGSWRAPGAGNPRRCPRARGSPAGGGARG